MLHEITLREVIADIPSDSEYFYYVESNSFSISCTEYSVEHTQNSMTHGHRQKNPG